MAQIELTWVEQQRFLGVDSAGHSILLSPPTDVGVKPSEALLIALAACAAHDVVEILHKQRAGLTQLNVLVTGEQAPESSGMVRCANTTTDATEGSHAAAWQHRARMRK